MPNRPPSRDDRHAAEAVEEVENQDEPKSGILDPHFDGDRTAVFFRHAESPRSEIADQYRRQVMQKDGYDDHADIVEKMFEIGGQCADDKKDEETDRKTFHPYAHFPRPFRKTMVDVHPQRERNAEQNDNRLDELPRADEKCP